MNSYPWRTVGSPSKVRAPYREKSLKTRKSPSSAARYSNSLVSRFTRLSLFRMPFATGRTRRGTPCYACPQVLRRRGPISPDSIFVHEGSPAVFDHHATVNDHGRNVAPLSCVYQRSNDVKRWSKMCAAEIEQHDVSFLTKGQTTKVLVAAKRFSCSERCHVKYVNRLPEIVHSLLLQTTGGERPAHSFNHVAMHVVRSEGNTRTRPTQLGRNREITTGQIDLRRVCDGDATATCACDIVLGHDGAMRRD